MIKHLHEILNNASLKLAMLGTQTQGEYLLVFQEDGRINRCGIKADMGREEACVFHSAHSDASTFRCPRDLIRQALTALKNALARMAGHYHCGRGAARTTCVEKPSKGGYHVS